MDPDGNGLQLDLGDSPVLVRVAANGDVWTLNYEGAGRDAIRRWNPGGTFAGQVELGDPFYVRAFEPRPTSVIVLGQGAVLGQPRFGGGDGFLMKLRVE